MKTSFSTSSYIQKQFNSRTMAWFDPWNLNEKARCGNAHLQFQHFCVEMGDKDRRITQKLPDQLAWSMYHEKQERYLLRKAERELITKCCHLMM